MEIKSKHTGAGILAGATTYLIGTQQLGIGGKAIWIDSITAFILTTLVYMGLEAVFNNGNPQKQQ